MTTTLSTTIDSNIITRTRQIRKRRRRLYDNNSRSYNCHFFEYVHPTGSSSRTTVLLLLLLLLLFLSSSTTRFGGRYCCYGMIHDIGSVRLQSHGLSSSSLLSSSHNSYYYIDYHEGLKGDTIEINLSDISFLSISSVVSAFDQQEEEEEDKNSNNKSIDVVVVDSEDRNTTNNNNIGDEYIKEQQSQQFVIYDESNNVDKQQQPESIIIIKEHNEEQVNEREDEVLQAVLDGEGAREEEEEEEEDIDDNVIISPVSTTRSHTSRINDDEVYAFTKFIQRQQKQQEEKRNQHRTRDNISEEDDDNNRNKYQTNNNLLEARMKNVVPSYIITNDDEVTAFNTFIYNIDYYSKFLEQMEQQQQQNKDEDSFEEDSVKEDVVDENEWKPQQQQQETSKQVQRKYVAKNEYHSTRNSTNTTNTTILRRHKTTTVTNEINSTNIARIRTTPRRIPLSSSSSSSNSSTANYVLPTAIIHGTTADQRRLVDSTTTTTSNDDRHNQTVSSSYIDILVFSVKHPISQHTTNWIDYGIGSYYDDTNEYAISFCCTKELIQQDKCSYNQLNRLLINETQYNGYYKSVSIPINDITKFQRQMKYDSNSILTFHHRDENDRISNNNNNNERSESYVVLFANCFKSSTEEQRQSKSRMTQDIVITGSISYRSEKGYLSRTLDSLQFFYLLLVPICIQFFIQYTILPMMHHYYNIYCNFKKSHNNYLRRSNHHPNSSRYYYRHYLYSPYKNTITDVVFGLGILQSVMKVLYYYILNESGLRLDGVYWISIAIGIMYKLGTRLIPVVLCRTGQSTIPFYNNFRMGSEYQGGHYMEPSHNKPVTSSFYLNIVYYVTLRLFIVLLIVNDILLGYNVYWIASSSVVSSSVPTALMTLIMIQRGCEFSMYLIYTIVGSLAQALRHIDERTKQRRSVSAKNIITTTTTSQTDDSKRLELLGHIYTLSAIITIGMAVAGLAQLLEVRHHHTMNHNTISSNTDHYLLSFWKSIETYTTFHTNSILKSIYADEIDCLANIVLLLLFLRKPTNRSSAVAKKNDVDDDNDVASTETGKSSKVYSKIYDEDETDYTEEITDSSDNSNNTSYENDDYDDDTGAKYTLWTSSNHIRNSNNNNNNKRRSIMKHTSNII